MRRGFALLVAAIVAVVVGAALDLPVGDLDSRIQRDVGDPLLNVWALSWESTALARDPGALFDGNIFWPESSSIAYSESMVPLVPVFGVLRAVARDELAANALLVYGLVLAAVAGGYALARRFVRHPPAALLCGLSYGLGGYTISHVAQVQLLTLGTFPVVFLLWFRALERRRWQTGVACGVAVAVTALASLYYGVALAPCLVGMAVVQLVAGRRWRDRRTLATVGVAAVTAVVLTVPGLVVYLELDDRQDLARAVDPALELQPDDLFTPPPGNVVYRGWADRGLRQVAANEHALFPGFAVLVLGAVGAAAVLRHERRSELLALLAAAVVAVVLAFGAEAGGVRLPFALLHDHVPGFDGIRATARLVAPAVLVLAVLAGVGLDAALRRVPSRRVVLAGAAATAVVVIEVWSPVYWVPVDRDDDTLAVYRELDDRDGAPVVELPMGDPRVAAGTGTPTWSLAEPSRMVRSLTDRNPRVNGYSGHLPERYLERVDRLNAFPSPDSLALLDELDVRYVVVHTGPAADGQPQYDDGEAEALVDALPAGWSAERHGRSWLLEAPPRR